MCRLAGRGLAEESQDGGSGPGAQVLLAFPITLLHREGAVGSMLGDAGGPSAGWVMGGRCPQPRMGLGDAQGSVGVCCQHVSSWREAQSAARSVVQAAEKKK